MKNLDGEKLAQAVALSGKTWPEQPEWGSHEEVTVVLVADVDVVDQLREELEHPLRQLRVNRGGAEQTNVEAISSSSIDH